MSNHFICARILILLREFALKTSKKKVIFYVKNHSKYLNARKMSKFRVSKFYF